jgi:precorrin-6B methylase 2
MKIPRIARQLKVAWADFNDWRLNIETGDGDAGLWRGEKTDKARHADNRAYATPDYHYINKIMETLKPGKQDVLYDIGSGKGRILCVAARKEVGKCVGIEVMDDLCELSRQNAAKLRGKRAPIEIRCEDAAVADMSDGTIYFLFNPFGGETLRDVLQNIARSLAEKPRRIRIVYYNSAHRDVFEKFRALRRDSTFQTLSGLNVDFYSNDPAR